MEKSHTEGIFVDFPKCTTYRWEVAIEGPEGTPFEGGDFKMVLSFPQDYPYKPPKVKFETKVYHPNVYTCGDICLDILQNKWQPTYTGEKTLLSIQSLFFDPNPSSPANGEAGQLYRNDQAAYNAKVRASVAKDAAKNQKARKAKEAASAEAKDEGKKEEKKEGEKEKASGGTKRKAESSPAEAPPATRVRTESAEDVLVANLVAEGYADEALVRQLYSMAGDDRDLLKSLYESQKAPVRP